jgi:hypothetical protein
MKGRNLMAAALFLLTIAGTNSSVVAASMQGHFRCGITDYMWPTSPEDAPTATGTATMEFESDGNGKFTTGSFSEHLADDTRTFGEKVCSFQLVSGEYHMNSPSAGTSTLAWRLQAGSDSHCGAWLRNANTPNLGYTESPRDYDTVSITGTFFILPNSTSKWINASEIGVAIGACSQIH